MLRVAERTLDDAVSPVISVVIPTQLDCPDLDFFIQSTHSALNGVVSFEIIVVRFESSEENLIVAAGSIPTAQFVELQGTPDTARAILLGLAHSRGNVIVVLDNPQAEPSVLLPPLTQPLLEDSSDIVICSDQNSSNSPGVPLWQRMSRRLAGMLAMPFVDVVDPTSGCFAARRYTFDEIDVENAGPQFIVALLATQCESVRVQEIPVEISTPGHDTPRENVRFAANYLRQLARLSGAVASSGSAIRFGIVGLLGVGVDLSIFMLLSSFGLSIGASHIASFFAATIFNYILNDIWSFKRPQSTPQSKLTFTRYGAYLLICVAALFVRGGVLASGLEFGLPATLSVVIAIAFATGINFLGSMLFVFAQTERVKASIRLRLAAVAIIGYSFVLRIAYVVAIDLLPEEAYYWNYAKHLDIGYLDHPPMIAWLIGLSTFLFGDTEFAVRLPAFACWLITLGFICALTNRIVGRSAAFAAGAVIATFPFFFLSGFIATPDSPLMACWAASIYFLYSALNDQRRSAWIGFGIAVGLGLLSKYTIALIGPVALILMLLNKDARRWFRDPFPYIAAILALVLFSPVIVWNANHEWISFAFQSVRRLEQTTQFGLPLLIGSIMILLTPVGFFSALRALSIRSRDYRNVSHWDCQFLFVSAIIPLSVFVIFTLQNDPKLNWTGPLWLALLPLMVLDLVPSILRSSYMTRVMRIPMGWKLTFIGVFLLFGGGFHYFAIGLPGLGYIKGMQAPVAWEEFGHAIEKIKDDVEPELSGVPIIVGMDQYFLASELAFYRTKAGQESENLEDRLSNTSSRHLFRHIGLMYEIWSPVERIVGSDCIIIGFVPDDVADYRIAPFFDSLTEIKKLTITKNNSPVHTFVWRVGYRYHLVGR